MVPLTGWAALLQPVDQTLSVWTIPVADVQSECGSLSGFKGLLSNKEIADSFGDREVHTVRAGETLYIAPGYIAFPTFFLHDEVETATAANYWYLPMLSKAHRENMESDIRECIVTAHSGHLARLEANPVWKEIAKKFSDFIKS